MVWLHSLSALFKKYSVWVYLALFVLSVAQVALDYLGYLLDPNMVAIATGALSILGMVVRNIGQEANSVALADPAAQPVTAQTAADVATTNLAKAQDAIETVKDTLTTEAAKNADQS
jgi:hypothetical protein